MEEKAKQMEIEEANIQSRDSYPIVIWCDIEPESPTQEEIYLAKNGLNVIYEENETEIIKLIQNKSKKVVAIVTEMYKKDEDNDHTSVAVGLNLANIVREDLKIELPIIINSERVKKDLKLQALCKKNDLKPVMRGSSLFKLLNVPEPPLGEIK